MTVPVRSLVVAIVLLPLVVCWLELSSGSKVPGRMWPADHPRAPPLSATRGCTPRLSATPTLFALAGSRYTKRANREAGAYSEITAQPATERPDSAAFAICPTSRCIRTRSQASSNTLAVTSSNSQRAGDRASEMHATKARGNMIGFISPSFCTFILSARCARLFVLGGIDIQDSQRADR